MKLTYIAEGCSRTRVEIMHQRNFESIHGAKRSRRGENTLRREKPVGESETLVFGELNPPKNSRIPWGSKEIANGHLWAFLMVVLERIRVRSERSGEGVSSA
jgi:hypothetical protein